MTHDRQSLAAELGRALAARPDVELALLFGSQARGTANADSDVDLAVRAPGVDPLALVSELGAGIGAELNVVELDGVTIPMLAEIVRDAIVVHEGRRGAAAEWRTRALLELETDLPWYRRMRDAWLARVAEKGL